MDLLRESQVRRGAPCGYPENGGKRIRKLVHTPVLVTIHVESVSDLAGVIIGYPQGVPLRIRWMDSVTIVPLGHQVSSQFSTCNSAILLKCLVLPLISTKFPAMAIEAISRSAKSSGSPRLSSPARSLPQT